MRGRHVARKAGWDTHGLAVEIEVEKRLGLSGKKDIEQLVPGDRGGLDREIQPRLPRLGRCTYERQWRAMTERVGYWIDLDDAYFTYANSYVESVWWSLKTLHEKGLLYEGHKSQPYCARCGTTLSSHEVAQNYKETDDPSIWVLFPVRPGQPIRTAGGAPHATAAGLHLVAWTTTPWTMPGHAGMAVHPDLLYRVVAHPERPGERSRPVRRRHRAPRSRARSCATARKNASICVACRRLPPSAAPISSACATTAPTRPLRRSRRHDEAPSTRRRPTPRAGR